jgi:hypothetical protein
MIRNRLPASVADLFPGCWFRVELKFGDRPGHERGALSGINVVWDMHKPEPDVPSAAADVFQHHVHRIVADVIAGAIGMNHLRAKVNVESRR